MTRTLTALNGRLPTDVLVDVGSGHLLRSDAAASYLHALDNGAPRGITDAYRTTREQQWLYDKQGHLGTAARPGTSWHGEGLALDLPEPARGWFASHGRGFGWRRTITYEPWHFEYFPEQDTHREDRTMPLTDDDVDRIAQRVWDLLLHDRHTGTTAKARHFLTNGNRFAALAATRAGGTDAEAVVDELRDRLTD